MSAGLTTCGILLWKRREGTNDYSRHIQAILSWLSAFFTLIFIVRTWHGTTTTDAPFFEPEHTFVPLLIQATFFFYPLEVIRPTISRSSVYALLFTPLLSLVFIGMCAGIKYTPIYTYADLWNHIGEFNVWFRLLTLTVMLFYCFSLFLVPYDWRKSSADKKFILRYATGFCLIGVLHFCIQMSHSYWFVLAHQLVWFAVFMSVCWYELKERLLVPKDATTATTQETEQEQEPATAVLEPEEHQCCETDNNGLWERITYLLDNCEMWRAPDLNLLSLSEALGSNRTYVENAFKQNTGMTFIKYITKRRIDYVTSEQESNPEADIHELFNYVGYRQRSTAWRNFQKITGITPTEFIKKISNKTACF